EPSARFVLKNQGNGGKLVRKSQITEAIRGRGPWVGSWRGAQLQRAPDPCLGNPRRESGQSSCRVGYGDKENKDSEDPNPKSLEVPRSDGEDSDSEQGQRNRDWWRAQDWRRCVQRLELLRV
ncbi:hypothetical protein U1Q18_013320, partial [Sarracenia purpurea var. burkii]